MQYRVGVNLAGFSGVVFLWFVSLLCAVIAQGVTFPAAHDVTAVLCFCWVFVLSLTQTQTLKTALHEPVI